ncbi:MAG: hypothetical protein JST49_14285, partial [Bacteroidetes bacterium]|nr:hypothetical protein [Bacteroidota bacterium]
TEVHEFGVASINGTSTTVQFDKDFKGALPVVNVTATKPGVYLAVTNVTANSFTIESDKALDNMQFNWMAFGKVKTSAERKAESNTTSSEVMEAIKVNPSIKERIQNYWLKELPAKLKADEEKAKQEAVAVTEERAKEINNGAKFADPAKGPVKVDKQ